MDPLAITASVIAVIGAAKKVKKSLRLLKDVKDAPDGLRDLLDHISRFESFLRASERGVPESDTDAPELRERLLEAKAKLVEIDQFAQYTLTEAGESSKVDRWQWVQKRSVVERFKRQLDEIRQDVMSLTHAGSYANSERVLVTVQAGASKQLQHYEDQGNSLARVEATLESLHTKIEQSSSTQEVLAEILGNFRQVTSEMNLGAKTNYPTPSLTTSDFKRRDARMKFDAERGMKSPRFTKTCRKACQCACHRDSSKRSSGFMYLQFSGLSFSYGRALCDMHACENSRGSFVSVSYCLPRWIASRNLSFWIGYSSLHGMNQSLKIRRMVSSSSPIAQAVIEGSLESFDKLVARGEGSPHDVDEFGDSFLTRALLSYGHNPERMRLVASLIDIGLESVPLQGRPYGTFANEYCKYLFLCSHFMRYADFRTSLSFLSKIDWDEVSQDMNFNELHKIVFGLIVRDLSSEISHCGQEINQEDVFGYTPLWYACRFGQEEIVRALLRHGANPDLGRRTLPLVASIQSESYSCVKLLFEHGAKAPIGILNADYLDYREGPYVEGVAESAEEDQILAIDRLMIERGFRWNCQYGRLFTALMCCCMAVTPAKSENRSFRQGRLKLLLENSIDLELRDSRGRTAMTHAVENSCTMVFNSLVQAGARLDVTRVEGWTVLHSVVLYTKSLSLIKALAKALSEKNLNIVDLDTRDQYGFTAYELLQRRKNPRWSQLVSEFDFPYLPPRYRWMYDEGQDQESDVIEGLETLFRQLREARGVKPDIRQPDSGISVPGAWPEVVPYR